MTRTTTELSLFSQSLYLIPIQFTPGHVPIQIFIYNWDSIHNNSKLLSHSMSSRHGSILLNSTVPHQLDSSKWKSAYCSFIYHHHPCYTVMHVHSCRLVTLMHMHASVTWVMVTYETTVSRFPLDMEWESSLELL